MKLFEINQQTNSFIVSWTPSHDPESKTIVPYEFYDFGVTTMPQGIYVQDEVVVVVSSTDDRALLRLKSFLIASGYLNDTWGDKPPKWIKKTHHNMSSVTRELESGNYEHIIEH